MASGRVDPARMRRANMSLILRHLRTHDGRSRARLADETGLSKATMSSLITDLVERRLVRDGDVDREGLVGRPGTTIALDNSYLVGIGLEINVDYAAMSSLDLCGHVVHQSVTALDVAQLPVSAVLDQIVRLLDRELRRLRASGSHVIAIGIAAPGVIDLDSGSVRFAPNLGWHGVPVAAGLKERLGPDAPPIMLENDAKLGAIGEYAALEDPRISDLVYLSGDVGVGLGIIGGGKLLRGWTGSAGEVGHLRMDPGGDRCKCGRTGCWETIVGLAAFLRLAAPDEPPMHDPLVPLEERLLKLRSRADAGEARTVTALETIAADLARGLSILVDVLNPQLVVLGGYFSFFGEYLVSPVTASLETRQIDPGSRAVVTASRLGLTSSARGGAHHALTTVFDDPTVVDPVSY